jgi:DNA-binding NarL/FixJ family response regulator
MSDLWQCVVERSAGAALDPLERLVIQQIVRGVSYKCIAYELGASSSTLHDRLTVALRRLGLNTRIAAVRLGAALTADDTDRPRALVFPAEPGDRRLAIVGMRPEPSRIAPLSPCERQIVFLALDGLSNAAIASRRQTSARTIANQLASVYQRVGVSGRLELARHLFEPAR